MTQQPDIAQCPFCGGTRFADLKSNGNAYVMRVGHPLKSAYLVYTACLDCGGIAHTRVNSARGIRLRKEENEVGS